MPPHNHAVSSGAPPPPPPPPSHAQRSRGNSGPPKPISPRSALQDNSYTVIATKPLQHNATNAIHNKSPNLPPPPPIPRVLHSHSHDLPPPPAPLSSVSASVGRSTPVASPTVFSPKVAAIKRAPAPPPRSASNTPKASPAPTPPTSRPTSPIRSATAALTSTTSTPQRPQLQPPPVPIRSTNNTPRASPAPTPPTSRPSSPPRPRMPHPLQQQIHQKQLFKYQQLQQQQAPPVPLRSVNGTPVPTPPTSRPTSPQRGMPLTARGLKASTPLTPGTVLSSASPMVLSASSPAGYDSPVIISSGVRTPNTTRSPAVPPRPAKFAVVIGDENRFLSASSAASTPIHSPNPLRSSVGIMAKGGVVSTSSSAVNSPAVQTPNRTNTSNSNDADTLKKGYLLKSPMVKDYLFNNNTGSAPSSPVMRRNMPYRRSVTPPPRAPPSDGETRPRNLSDPVPVNWSSELADSNDGISMPYNIKHNNQAVGHHTKNELAKSDNHVLAHSTNTPITAKSGYLFKLAGSNWKERWFVCNKSTMTYFAKKTDSKPRSTIFLNDCEFEKDKQNKRPNTLRIIHLPTKKNYYVSLGHGVSTDVLDEWIRVLHGCGAVDKDFVTYERDALAKKKKEEAAAKARAQRKLEDDYVKEKMKKRSTLMLTNKNMTDTAIIHCGCNLYVKSAISDDDKSRTVFCIEVNFDDQNWIIYRKYEKIATLFNAVCKLKMLKGMCPARKAPKFMSDADFTNLQISQLQDMLNMLSGCRASVMASTGAKHGFLRFLAPVGWEDTKPEKFIMPFAIIF